MPPWAEFRAVSGLGLPGEILIEAQVPPEQAAAELATLVAHLDLAQVFGVWLRGSYKVMPAGGARLAS